MATQSSYAQDNAATSAIDGTYLTSDDLTLSAYNNLNVPSGATINGITLTWTGGSNGGWNGENNMMSVSNNDGSSFSGKLSTDSTIRNSPTLDSAVYGGATNLWGLTWTAEQANSIQTNFYYNAEGPVEADRYGNRHDAFQITIHYTLLPSGKIIIPSGLVKISSGKITL